MRATSGIVIFCTAGSLWGQQPEATYRFRIAVELVVLDVAVVDQKGRFVTGLERENFEVFQDGQPQPITLFRKEDSPVTVGLVVDSSTSMLPKRQETIAAALAFVEASHPQDEIFVVNFSDTAQPGLPAGLPFTSDPSVLAAALKAARPFGRTALYDALALAIRHLELGRHERKALVVFSDGGDNQSMHSLEDVMRLIQQSGVTIYAIGLYDSANRERNPQVLRRLAEESGGRAFFVPGLPGIRRICQRIAAEMRSRYVLGYVPRQLRSGEYHVLDVRVHAPGRGKLIVRTRKGFRAP